MHLALGRVLVNMSLLTQAQRSFALAAGIPVDQVHRFHAPYNLPPCRRSTCAYSRLVWCCGCLARQHVPQFWLSVTAAKQGRFEDAASHLRNCLFYAPNFFPALHNLGSMQLIQVGPLHASELLHALTFADDRATLRVGCTTTRRHYSTLTTKWWRTLPVVSRWWVSHALSAEASTRVLCAAVDRHAA